jgi:hypothetical protein
VWVEWWGVESREVEEERVVVEVGGENVKELARACGGGGCGGACGGGERGGGEVGGGEEECAVARR